MELDRKHREEVMTALPNKCYSGCHKTTKEQDNQEIFRKKDLKREMWTAGFRFSWQHKTYKWSVACAQLGATRHKSSYYYCYCYYYHYHYYYYHHYQVSRRTNI